MAIETLTNELTGLFDEIVENRRFLHRNPELSFQEEKTSRFIADTLKSYGISVQENVGDKGVVGFIQGKEPGKTIAFRADFDALPIEDQKEVTYKSTVPGVMHACGHDGHTATLLAMAKVLQKHKDSFHGTAKFIFQPAEEKPPGGAKFMIEDGVLDDVDYVFGAHLATDLPIGKLSTASNAIMASVDAFTIKIFGKGGHGARPHETKDSIIAATQLVQHLQQIVSRRINPTEAAFVTVGSIHAGNACNCRLYFVRLYLA
ncbi:amidohydrolase [Lysinibacillus agricola]|uniref:Amidohydrolase n=1 Tax=Lysinibacillus agricola TaxID=2590012 RepID=A0ABX7AX20_9BACI|nr:MULTISPECIES: amidohydrolase [Lysinibacillus]QQP14518.1 amidohydrolase [Lysinibacillus agricola]